jgi:uncharacterized protein (DUF952 family)
MLVYKILTAPQWAEFEEAGEFDGSPADLEDGFIHLSTGAQAPGTAAKHFAGQGGLVLAAINEDVLFDGLRWEVSRGGDLFPHLYRKLFLDDVSWVKLLRLGENGAHVFPDEVAA